MWLRRFCATAKIGASERAPASVTNASSGSTAPMRPSPCARSSSSAAQATFAVGSVASPEKRVGCFFTTAATFSFCARQIGRASSGDSTPSYDAPTHESTCRCTPASSIRFRRASMSNQPAPCGGRGDGRAASSSTTFGPTQCAWKSMIPLALGAWLVSSAAPRVNDGSALAATPSVAVSRNSRRVVIWFSFGGYRLPGTRPMV